MKHLVNWIEIPVTDMERAVRFYSAVLQEELMEMELGGNRYAMFPSEDTFNNGALVCGTHYKPSGDGVQIYLDGGSDLSLLLSRVEAAGGQVIMNKTYLGTEAGHVGMFIDSEGNRIGLQHG